MTLRLARLHWTEYLAEMLGIAILLFGGTSALIINFGINSPTTQLIPDESVRLLLTGLGFASTGSLVAISPIGKRSGAHINPAITLSFWLLKMMHARDFVGYLSFQFIGASLGSAVAMLVWADEFWAINGALTAPGIGISALEAFLVEILMTFILVISILTMLSRHRTAKLTPLMLVFLISFEVLFGAPISGTSLNPARSLGPALVTNVAKDQWIYFSAPIIGALLATGVYHFKILGAARLKTAKIFHTPHSKCIFHQCQSEHVH